MNVKELQDMVGKWGRVFHNEDTIIIILAEGTDNTPEDILIKIEDLNFGWHDGEYYLL